MDFDITVDSADVDVYLTLTTKLVASFVAYNHIAALDMPAFILSTHAAISGLHRAALTVKPTTPAQILASIQREALISFEDGTPHKILKRHLKARGLTPETYRAKWGLPSDYPMIAPGYADRRSKIARSQALKKLGVEVP